MWPIVIFGTGLLLMGGTGMLLVAKKYRKMEKYPKWITFLQRLGIVLTVIGSIWILIISPK